MKIDRHNYEEYFILYMDNELSSENRRMVEAFVQQHPDLKEELDLLLQYKLVPDTSIVFNNKEELMIPVSAGMQDDLSSLTPANYEEWLMLYTDNELTTGQKITVEQFIADKPALKEELALLQLTRLPAERIIFAGKAALYRKEEKVRPLPVRWWKIAAAAVLLLGIGITTAVIVNQKSSGDKGEIVKENTKEQKTNTVSPVVIPKEVNAPVNENIVAENNKQPVAPIVKQAATPSIASSKNNPVIKPGILTEKVKDEQAVVSNKQNNELPQPLNNPNVIKDKVPNKDIAVISSEKNKQQDPLTNDAVTTQTPPTSDIIYASLDQPDGKKGKLRGFFRKVTRTFEKRTDLDPTEDNKLLIAGLSFKLK